MTASPAPRPLRLPAMPLFALAALAPVAMLAAAPLGGLWAALPLLYLTLFAAALDQFVPLVAPDAPDGAEFPAAEALLLAVAGAHFALLPWAVWAVAGDSELRPLDRGLILAAAGLWVGQVAVPAAHELIHRPGRWRFRLGAAIYASILFGHHASAHRLVHHVHAASRQDPNTARAGEGYWRFLIRAWAGSFRAGLAAEAGRRRPGALHPYAGYTAGAALALVVAAAVAGGWGVAAWTVLSLHAQSQLLLSDYVQHYGLTRRILPDGRLEPVAARHSWNAPHWFTGAMMLHAPRHSDHHAHPALPYPALRLPAAEEAPLLPWALPVACVIALVPPLWRRAMAPHLARWRA